MSRIYRRAGVDEDIYLLARYLLDHSESAATRFVDAVQSTLKDLASMPRIGSPKIFNDPALAAVRSWRVKGYRNYVIYYIALDDGIDVPQSARSFGWPRQRGRRSAAAVPVCTSH